MSKQTRFVRGNDRLNEMLAEPEVAADVAEIRAQMAEDDRTYAAGLAAIRRAADLTQVQLAQQLGVPQSTISRLEQRHDMLLSTLTSYLSATGDHPRVVVTVNGQDVELDLTALTALRHG